MLPYGEISYASHTKSQQGITPTNTKEIMDTTIETNIETLTANCITEINKEVTKEVESWIKQGRLIKQFVEDSGKTENEAFKLLESHTDSVHKISQLRNLMKATEVYDQIPTEESDIKHLSLTCFIVVQNKRLTPHQRNELLKKALKEKLSISELKKAVADEIGSVCSKPSEVASLLNRLTTLSANLSETLPRLNDEGFSDNDHDEILSSLNQIVALAVHHDCIDLNKYTPVKSEKAA